MARVKLSEFRAKHLLYDVIGKYDGVSIDLHSKNYQKDIQKLSEKKLYVAKIDQAVKKRGKSGLVAVGLKKNKVSSALNSFKGKGYRYALVEPFIEHKENEERYISLSRQEEGVVINYSDKGGVDIESNADSIQRALISSELFTSDSNTTELDNRLLEKLFNIFQQFHLTLLEINPILIRSDNYFALDAAIEIDSAAEFFASGAWSKEDIREANTELSLEEQAVEELKSVSPASFNLKVLNPNGAVFLLLSGGGASVVVADELASSMDFKKIGNYGEYSGNPSEDETYLYTKEVLNVFLNSKSKKKVLLIAGGVANFTDVAKTFAGIIRAVDERAVDIKKQKAKIFIRRGGPNQEAGLSAIKNYLDKAKIINQVHGPEYSLAQTASTVAKEVG